MSPPFLRVATVLVLVLAGCDAAPEPEPSAFTLTAEDAGGASTSVGAAPAADVEAVARVEVVLAPLRGEPADPALASRYEAMRVAADVLTLATGVPHEPGHYRVRIESDAGAAVATAPADCDDDVPCLSLTVGDSRLAAPGALFFVIAADAAKGPAVRFRPFGLGGGGRVVFEGDGASQAIAAPRLAASPSLTTGLGADASIRVARGTDVSEVLVVVRRSAAVVGEVLRPTEPERRVAVPAGEGEAEVYLLRTPAAD